MAFPLRDYYKFLTPENRGHYWVIMTNVLVVILTFWLGVAIQNKVASKSAQASLKLAHYEIVDRMYPAYIELIDASQNIIGTLGLWATSESSLERKKEDLENFIRINKNDILACAASSVKISGKYKYYFSRTNSDKVSENNGLIMIGLNLLESINEQKDYPPEQLKQQIINYMTSAEYFLLASHKSNVDDLAKTATEIIVASKEQQRKNVEEIEFEIINRFILPRTISNLKVIKDEMDFANEVEENHWWENIKILLLAILIGMVICNLFARFIAPKRPVVTTYVSGELKEMKKTLDDHQATISSYKANMHSKDDEIDMLRSDLSFKDKEIAILQDQLNSLKNQSNNSKEINPGT